MNKRLLTMLAMCISCAGLQAQDIATRYFEIVPPKNKVTQSLYNTVEFLDSRGDTSHIGTISVGLLKNRDAMLKLKTPFQQQLSGLITELTDSTARDGRLLFQLKQFDFVETYGTRYCYLGAALYAKQDAGYKRLSILDTILIVRIPDVAKAIQKEGNKIISDFVSKGLLLQPADTTLYPIEVVENIDSVEKRQIPVYNTTAYSDGLYTSYASFKNQAPDMQGLVALNKDGSVSSVKMVDSAGKKIKLKSKSLYAVITKGKLFIATEYGYYSMQKISDNFYFTGNVRVAASSGDISTGQIAFGLVGAALASSGNEARYDMIIDHLTGKFIHITRLKIDTD